MSRNGISNQKAITLLSCLALFGFLQTARSETTTFEDPLVSGVPTSLPAWSGFSPVVLQYGDGAVQDAVAGVGTQALEVSPGGAVAWSPAAEPAPGDRAVTTFLVRHDVFSTDAAVIPAEELSTVLFVNNTGLLALDGNTSGGGTWQTLQSLSPGVFYEVSVTSDYAAMTYDVEIDGSLVADDLGFKDSVTNRSYLATFDSSGQAWLDEVSASFLSETDPPTPDPMTWATLPTAGKPAAGGSVVLSTDFTGRTVNSNTASNIPWITDGVADPGDLTALGPAALDGLFTTTAAADRFIPDLNLRDQGSWSADVTLALTGSSFSLQNIVLDYQHLGNSGTIPTVNKNAKLTVSVSGSVSGLLDSVSITHNVPANDGSGSDTFSFSPALSLDDSQTYGLKILAEGAGSGANLGLDALTLRKESGGIVDTDTSIRMTASTATDTSGVEYYFECISGGGHDSGWQESPEYIDIGLSPGTRHTYRIRARDKSTSQNTGGWSAAATATTTGAPPPNSFAEWVASFGLDANDQDFEDDPDRDHLANGLEAWFGTHPGEFNPGLVGLANDGTTTTFEHPQNETPPSDLSGFYEWSPNLTDWYADGSGPGGGPTVSFVPTTTGTTTTVTANASEALERLFLRIGVIQN